MSEKFLSEFSSNLKKKTRGAPLVFFLNQIIDYLLLIFSAMLPITGNLNIEP